MLKSQRTHVQNHAYGNKIRPYVPKRRTPIFEP